MDKVAELLDKFASLVGVQVDRLWPQLVRVFWLHNLVEIIVTPFFFWLLVSIGVRCAKKSNEASESSSDSEGTVILYGIAAAVVGFAALITAIAYIFSFGGMLTGVIYPEASYVKSLLKLASPSK